MKLIVYDTLMEIWDDYLSMIEDLKDNLVEQIRDIPFTDKSREEILYEMCHIAGRISGLEQACDKLRSLTKHADVEEE